MEETKEETKGEGEETRLRVHPSGIQYYAIKLWAAESEETMELRLFESFSPGRLKWDDDQETHDEYKVRRNYIRKNEKEYKKGTLVWNAGWGTFNEANALRIQAAINEGKDLKKIGKLK
jgi:hypothetical protein